MAPFSSNVVLYDVTELIPESLWLMMLPWSSVYILLTRKITSSAFWSTALTNTQGVFALSLTNFLTIIFFFPIKKEKCPLKDYPWFFLCWLSASSGGASAFVMALPGQRLDGRFFQKKCIIWKLSLLHPTVYLTLWTNYAAVLLIRTYFRVVYILLIF